MLSYVELILSCFLFIGFVSAQQEFMQAFALPKHYVRVASARSAKSSSSSRMESLISNHAVASHREQEVVARGEYFRAEHC